MPYQHTLIFDDSLNMLWKDWADRAVVDYRFNRSVKGSAQGCAHAMGMSLEAGGSLRLHTDLAFRSHAALSVQFWVRGASAQFDGRRCDSPSPSARDWHCAAAVCLALWRSWGGQPAVQMVPLCSLAQVDQQGWHKVSVPASIFAASFGKAFDEVVFLAGAQPAGRHAQTEPAASRGSDWSALAVVWGYAVARAACQRRTGPSQAFSRRR